MALDKRDSDKQSQPGTQPKKPYSAPKLIVHGNVETLTRAGPNGHADGILAGSHL
jgi:hypothetical protein